MNSKIKLAVALALTGALAACGGSTTTAESNSADVKAEQVKTSNTVLAE